MPDPVPEPMDPFTPDETRALAPSFTNTDRTVFALVNLPEVVKGALFARYSRSAKSLRRLFLDEFLGEGLEAGGGAPPPGAARARPPSQRPLSQARGDPVGPLGRRRLARLCAPQL